MIIEKTEKGKIMSNNLFLIHYKPQNIAIRHRIFSSSVRQYFADNFPHPLFHNHNPDGKSIYRSKGSPFQFKVINNEVFILALNEGVDFAKSFQWPDEINMPLGHTGIIVGLKLCSKTSKQANFKQIEFRCYRNISPYIALNQDKYKAYSTLSECERRNAVEKGLVDHILTSAKWCEVTVSHQIQATLIQKKEGNPLKIKDELFFTPFDVMFECNTEIPDYIGIGKFVSRGYGTMVQYG